MTTQAKYKDRYGDLWIRINDYYILRLRDGNIGVWDNGKGLVEL